MEQNAVGSVDEVGMREGNERVGEDLAKVGGGCWRRGDNV